jgi:hypothetical protein
MTTTTSHRGSESSSSGNDDDDDNDGSGEEGGVVSAALLDWTEAKRAIEVTLSPQGDRSGEEKEKGKEDGGVDASSSLATNAGRFDVVVASDVLYDDATVTGLVDTAVLLLGVSPPSPPHSKDSVGVGGGGGKKGRELKSVLVTDPETERVPGCRAAFVAALKERGATEVSVLPLPPVASTTTALSSYTPVGRPERTVLIQAFWGGTNETQASSTHLTTLLA